MVTLQYKTRGHSSPQGKERVYFTAHPEDFPLYYEEITNDILKTQNCVIYSDPEPQASRTLEEIRFELDRMQLLVVPITARFLYTENRARTIEFRYAQQRHIPILPLMYEPGLDREFNRICGDLQFLDKHNTSFHPIPYEEKLKKYLESVLLGDDLAQQVRQAFDAYIFLSYRKKDRVYAQELMTLIHKNDFCRDIAIWYDEYLTPGESFHDAISAAMEKSKLFTLAVTPNLVNEENYVMTVEYPEAVKAEKPILPIQMEHTLRESLEQHYKNIPATVDGRDAAALSQALKEKLKTIAIAENDSDPQHLFFIGLAYLGGIDVEVDHARAVTLITRAADMDFPEAMAKLSSMYRTGEGVPFRYSEAVMWKERQMDLAVDTLGETHPKTLETMIALAELYEEAGNDQEARDVLGYVLATQRQLLGKEDPKTLETLLSYVKYTAPEEGPSPFPEEEQALETFSLQLGEAHPKVLLFMDNLVQAYRRADRLEDALTLGQRVWNQRSWILGEDHPDTLVSMAALAQIHFALGHMETALTMETALYETFCQTLGENHPHTLTALELLGRIHYQNGNSEQGLNALETVLQRRTQILGQQSPATLTAASTLASWYTEQNRLTDALPLAETVVRLADPVLGEHQEETLAALDFLMKLYVKAHRASDAVPICRELTRRLGSLRDPKDPQSLEPMTFAAQACLDAGCFKEAEEFAEQLMVRRTRLQGADHIQTLNAMALLMQIYAKAGRPMDAVILGESILDRSRKNHNFPTGNVTYLLSSLYNRLGMDDKRYNLKKQIFKNI